MASVSLTTSVGGINLNDRTNYFLRKLKLGVPAPDEVWFLPWSTATPTLAAVQVRPVKMLIGLWVVTATAADFIVKVEAVRGEFAVSNTLAWVRGGASETITTYKSTLGPIDTDADASFLPFNQFKGYWEFEVWRHPRYSSDTGILTPVI